jgi:hypothetical protein
MDRPHHLGQPMSMDTAEPINLKRVERVWRCFDANARLQRWPNKRSEQMLAVWGIWAYLPSDTRWNEAEFSAILRGWHDFDDFAMVRRELCDLGLVQRTPDGRIYRRVDHPIPEEVAALVARFSSPPS